MPCCHRRLSLASIQLAKSEEETRNANSIYNAAKLQLAELQVRILSILRFDCFLIIVQILFVPKRFNGRHVILHWQCTGLILIKV